MKIRGKLSIVKAMIFTVMTLGFTSGSGATIFWDYEMEPGDRGFDISGLSGVMTYDTSVKFSGNGSIRLDYPSQCYPDQIGSGSQCGGFTDKSIPPTQTLWTRFYVMLSSDFVVGNTETKIMFSSTNSTVSDWLILPNGSTNLRMDLQALHAPDTRAYVGGTLTRGQWECVETMEKLSTIGGFDGVREIYLNGTLMKSVTGIDDRYASNPNELFVSKRLYRQVGQGSIWLDRVATGDQRIGCSGSAIDTTTPPPVPTSLRVQ